MKKYNKIVVGFVSQNFERQKDGKFLCTDQDFICGDDVTREDEMGDVLSAVDMVEAHDKEVYQSYDMIQSGLDHYVLKMIGCVEPVPVGPFATEKEAQERVEEYRNDPNESQNAHTTFSITKGAKFNI